MWFACIVYFIHSTAGATEQCKFLNSLLGSSPIVFIIMQSAKYHTLSFKLKITAVYYNVLATKVVTVKCLNV